MNDFRIPVKEELEYAQSFSPNVSKKSDPEVDKSKSGKPDKLGLCNLFGNVNELNSSLGTAQTSSGQVGFRVVSTFLGK